MRRRMELILVAVAALVFVAIGLLWVQFDRSNTKSEPKPVPTPFVTSATDSTTTTTTVAVTLIPPTTVLPTTTTTIKLPSTGSRKTTRTSQVAASRSAPRGDIWLCIRTYESGNNYAEDTGNGYYGAYQFALATWHSIGGTGYPDDAPPAVQDAMARKALSVSSYHQQWPRSSRLCGV